MLPPVVDDLQVKFVPQLTREESLQVGFGLPDILSARQSPALGESVNVGIDGDEHQLYFKAIGFSVAIRMALLAAVVGVN